MVAGDFLGRLVPRLGLFNFIEGGIDHLILGVHHVNEFAPNPMTYDLAFQGSGVILLVVGWMIIRSTTTKLRNSS